MMSQLSHNEIFWSNHGKRIDWFKPYTKIKNVIYSKEDVSIKLVLRRWRTKCFLQLHRQTC